MRAVILFNELNSIQLYTKSILVMKNFFNSRVSVALLAALFFTGCAGISDANLSDIDGSVQDESVISQADFTSPNEVRATGEEGEVIFGDGDQEDIIIVEPRHRDNRNR